MATIFTDDFKNSGRAANSQELLNSFCPRFPPDDIKVTPPDAENWRVLRMGWNFKLSFWQRIRVAFGAAPRMVITMDIRAGEKIEVCNLFGLSGMPPLFRRGVGCVAMAPKNE